MAPHKGTELNNIKETWDQNDKERNEAPGADNASTGTTAVNGDLQDTIKEEAAEYDNANKEDRVLGGDRASVNDDGDQR